MTLKSRLALRLVFMPVMWGSLLFLPAGSFRFWQGWVYFMITLAFILSTLGYLYRHDPQLIERRLRGGWRQETVRQQKLIMKLIAATMLIAFLLPGLDHRFGWSHAPLWLTTVAEALVLGGYLMIFWTLKSNSFAASTIRVEAGQRVISTGPYRIVRHPMYLGVRAYGCCSRPWRSVRTSPYLFLPSSSHSSLFACSMRKRFFAKNCPAILNTASTRASGSCLTSGKRHFL